jgi:hypothetical protein
MTNIKIDGPIMLMPVDDDEYKPEPNTGFQLLWFLATIVAIFALIVVSS